MERNKAFDLTGEQVMAQLTPEEIEGFNLSLPQMTQAAKRFVYLLAQERIRKAALLAACKAVEFVWIQDSMIEVCPWCGGTKLLGHDDNCQRQSAIKAGEGV
jgi:hypothetical protein